MSHSDDTIMHKIMRQMFQPSNMLQKIWRCFPIGSFGLRVYFDATPRPYLAYCMYHMAIAAKQLGFDKVSVIEFGVAQGAGLLCMERLAANIEKEISIELEIYGFDTGQGMPKEVDYRDAPYLWQEGFFKMNREELESKLKRAQLIIGDVAETVPGFFKNYSPAPIGFVVFDLDFYSSTVNALEIFNVNNNTRLPRTFCYFDDLVGVDHDLLCEYVGERRAIDEYNQQNKDMKIAKIYGLSSKRWVRSYWHEQVFILHDFKHPMYNKYILTDKERQMPTKKY